MDVCIKLCGSKLSIRGIIRLSVGRTRFAHFRAVFNLCCCINLFLKACIYRHGGLPAVTYFQSSTGFCGAGIKATER